MGLNDFPQNSQHNSKTALWIFFVIFILLVFIIVFFLFNSREAKITSEEFYKGKQIEIKEKEVMKIEEISNEYLLRIDSIKSNSIIFSIKDELYAEELEKNISVKFDLDNNNEYDLLIRLENINEKEAKIFIKKIKETINNSSSSQTGTNQTEFIECAENDWVCFIQASENCDKARMKINSEGNLFGVLNSGEALMEIKGLLPSDNTKCSYYQQTLNTTLRFDDEIRQSMIDSGITMEQILEQEQNMTETSRMAIGVELTCNFLTSEFNQIVTSWSHESSSSSTNCSLFEGECDVVLDGTPCVQTCHPNTPCETFFGY